jgi:hypothetical protein
MVITSFANAPTGFLGLGRAGLRPATCVAEYTGTAVSTGTPASAGIAMSGVPAQLQGTGLPVAARTAVRLRPAPQHMFIGFTTNDGTTLGNPSSRRPPS